VRLVECVPNFSEGRRKEVVDEIVKAIESVEGITVLDVEMDPDHNRSVVTFVGEPEAVLEAAFRGVKRAAELIDMDQHRGAHPRFGAADVVPFVPVEGVSMTECVELAHRLGKRIGEELGIPVYLYDKAATREDRRVLSDIRNESFQYEQLKEAIGKDDRWIPDYGPRRLGKAGATIVGARDFLIAFNVNLGTDDVGVAKAIARAVRGKTGGLAYVRALGFPLKERGIAQVSMNLVNYKRSPIYRTFELVKMEAERYGVPVVESEIVGLVPMDALLDVAEFYLRLRRFRRDQVLEKRLWNLLKQGAGGDFVKELASATPSPGGGSASAEAGAMAAALVAMVAGLTSRRRKYADVKDLMLSLRQEAMGLVDEFLELRRRDAQAFEALLAARRMRRWSRDEVESRERALIEASRKASEVPLRVMELSARVLEMASVLAEKGLKSAISDVGTAIELARSAAMGAFLNVAINCSGVPELEDLLEKGRELKEAVQRLYEGSIARVEEGMGISE